MIISLIFLDVLYRKILDICMTCQEPNSSINLNEMKNDLTRRDLFSSVSAWLFEGRASDVNLRGSQQQLETVRRVMIASRQFHEELNRPNASLQSIAEKLEEKHSAAERFEASFGVRWLL